MDDKYLESHVRLPYRVEIYPEADGSGYTAEIPELPGCITCAETLDELWEMIEDAKAGWLELALEDGDPIPEPSLVTEEATEHIVVHVPTPLHRRLLEKARREGVSLERWVVKALAAAATT